MGYVVGLGLQNPELKVLFQSDIYRPRDSGDLFDITDHVSCWFFWVRHVMGHWKTNVLCCTSGGSWRQRSMTFYFTPYLGISGQKWFLSCSWFILYPILIILVSNKRELIFLSLDNQFFGVNGPCDLHFGWKCAVLVIFLQIWRNILPQKCIFTKNGNISEIKTFPKSDYIYMLHFIKSLTF